MNRLFKRSLAGFLALYICTAPVLASTYGDLLHSYQTPVSETGTVHTEQYWSDSLSNLRTEHYFTYTPDEDSCAVVQYGSSILSKLSFANMASLLEKDGKRIISGINGDFFVVKTGDPLGIIVTDGILRSSSSYLNAIGFKSDGSAVIGKPDLSITAHIDEYALRIADINKVRTEKGGYYLLSEDFSANTQNTQAGVDVILSPVTTRVGTTIRTDEGKTLTKSKELKIGSRITCKVIDVLDSTSKVDIPEDQFVLTINRNGSEFLTETLEKLKVGNTLDIDIASADPVWEEVQTAIGALYVLIEDGKIPDSLEQTRAPRTAVGIKEDGSVLFYTVDGRQKSWSAGASLQQVAERMLELGCVDALCLDGGGSTSFGATLPNSDHFSILNRPSEKARPVSNALFLVATKDGSGNSKHIYVEPTDRTLLSGSKTTLKTCFTDETWTAINSSDDITLSAKHGTIDENGVYTAPMQTVVDEITATAADEISGTASISVFHEPSEIILSHATQNTTLSKIDANATQNIPLQASAFYKKLPLKADNTQFTWSVSPESLGSIDEKGVLTTGSTRGNGTIEVSYGETKASIPLSVNLDIERQLLEDFESTEDLTFTSDDENVQITKTSVPSKVHLGQSSLQVNYASRTNDLNINTDFSLASGQNQLSFWTLVRNPETKMSINCEDDQSISYALPVTLSDTDSWQHIQLTLPANTKRITGIHLSGNLGNGQILFDHFITGNHSVADDVAPSISLSITETEVKNTEDSNAPVHTDHLISATITDAGEPALQNTQISLTANGTPIPFTFDVNTGKLQTCFSTDTSTLQQISVTAKDNSGNLTRVSDTIEPTSEAEYVFSDMHSHWAKPYTIAMQQHGITNGITTDMGVIFDPDNSITRGDFALMTARFMELDLAQYTEVNLPFVDTDEIPFWSVNAVKAMYKLGIMKGSKGVDGLYANASDSITRAEAMTILGRILPKGFKASDITSFTDANLVPSWAEPYVALLIEQEIVTGYENRLRPNEPVRRAEVAKMLFASW